MSWAQILPKQFLRFTGFVRNKPSSHHPTRSCDNDSIMMGSSPCKKMKEYHPNTKVSLKERSSGCLPRDIDVEIKELRQVIKIMLEKESSYLCQIEKNHNGFGNINKQSLDDEKMLSRSPVTVTTTAFFAHSDLIGDRERYEVRFFVHIDFRTVIFLLFLNLRSAFYRRFLVSCILGCQMDVQGEF